ncbi:MAG: hypothetical protein ACRD4F_09270, partial [Candidatus Angelobacter sp.]
GMTDAWMFLSGSQSPYSVWEEEDWSDGTIEDFPATGTSSGNPSALQIYSTSGGDMANIFTLHRSFVRGKTLEER